MIYQTYQERLFMINDMSVITNTTVKTAQVNHKKQLSL